MNDLIRAHLNWTKAANLSPNTTYLREVVLRLADRELPNGLLASDEELIDWLATDRHGRPWTPKTKATYFECLKAFYEWALVQDKLTANPMVRMRRPRVPQRLPRPVTDRQLAILLSSEQPYRLAVVLAAYAGLRCCEIATLTPADADETMIRVRGKGGKVATVDTHPRVWRELSDLPSLGSVGSNLGAPFIVAAGGWTDPRRLSGRAGIYFRRHFALRVTLHMCRHWYVTGVLEATGNLEAARQAARHASVASTQGYVELRNGQRKTGICALPVLDAAVS